MGGDGVKLFYYYHPEQREHAERQNRRLREIVAACATQDVPLYLEPILYGVTDSSALPRLVLQSAIDAAAVGADILKLEFPAPTDKPRDWPSACEAISAAVDKPWTLLSAGVEFETYCAQVQVACRAGASGYIAGRAVWGDACAIADRGQRRAWLVTEGRSRLARLNDILARDAKSFRARWPEAAVGPAWFAEYGSRED
jgi:tagatose 1,6-diphosphate aldolase